MKSYDYDCVAYDCDYYCVQCLPKGIEPDNEEVHPIFADSEMDSYPSCCQCGGKHDYMGLTTDGIMHEATGSNHAEIFEMPASEFAQAEAGSWHAEAMDAAGVDWTNPESVKAESEALAGWYWWTCLPGCLPDSEAMGPFKSELEAAIDNMNL
jgi:hypothetical protein